MLPLSCTPIHSPLPYNTGPPVDAWIWFGSPLSTDWPRETSVWHTGFQDWAPGPKVHRPLGGRTCRIAGPATRHSRCMYQARQMALLSRILSLHWSFRPLKFFHFGDTSFPLKGKMRRGHSVVSLTINVPLYHPRPQSSGVIHASHRLGSIGYIVTFTIPFCRLLHIFKFFHN